MSSLPPGASGLIRIVTLCVVVVGVLSQLQKSIARIRNTEPLFALWHIILASPIIVVFTGILRRLGLRLSRRLEMKRMGGAPLPVVKGKRFGNVDIVPYMLDRHANGYPGDFLAEWVTMYGPQFEINVLGDSEFFTIDPNDVKCILATEFNSFEKGPKFRKAGRSLLGSGVFNADGDIWKFHRSISRPFFSKDRITDFDIFARHSAAAVLKARDRLRSGLPVDFQDVAARFAMDSATEFLFGRSVDSLDSMLPYPHNVTPPEGTSTVKRPADVFVQSFAEAQLITTRRLWLGPIWVLSEFFNDKTRVHMKAINAFIDPILHRALEAKKRKAKTGKSELPITSDDDATTLLDHLVTVTDDAKLIRDEIINIMVAGRDTTSVTLTFAVYFMALHPKVLQRVREEILSKFGATRNPSYEELRDLKFLRAVINETLRLMPPVPFNVREATKSVLLPSKDASGRNYFVPAGRGISYSVLLMHRRKDLWGQDADEFDPDRFLDDRLHKYLTPNPYIFLPFNAGPRICLGQQFAYNEMSFFLVKLLQTFDEISLAPDAQPLESRPPASWKNAEGRQAIEQIFPTSHLTLHVKGGLWVKMRESAESVEEQS